MFEWLFKFSELNFAEGEVGFQAGRLIVLFGVLLLFLLVGFVVTYSLTNAYTSDRTKAVSLGLRIPALLLLFIPLLEPVLIMPDVVPDENFVAVLVDGSESMNLPDGANGETRREAVHDLLFGRGQVARGLEEAFKVRYYTFGKDAARTDSLTAAGANGRETNVAAALKRVLADFNGVPLAGLVLMTDGADNSQEVPLTEAEELRRLGIPLHIVGFGREAFDREREILDVQVSDGVEETTGAEIDVKVRSWSDEPEPVVFNVYRDDQLVLTQERPLKGNGKIDQLTFYYEPRGVGADEYTVEIADADREINTVNNRFQTLIDTRRDTLRVLYFEGQLRRDFKYIKRALEDDQVVRFTSVAQTGTGKFYRQGIEHPNELAGGFPVSEEELYRHQVIIFGDVDASAYSIEQLRMIEKAVRIRGSGFLMLGGQHVFSEGNFWNTPITDLLPVDLDPSRRTAIPERLVTEGKPLVEQGFRFVPTPAGLESPILRLSVDPAANQAQWSEMPGLTSLNLVGPVKPGAIVLAEKPEDEFGDREPILAVQRYGKGRSAALTTSSTWRWQMLLEADDMRFERFWRQLTRWLAASAPKRVNLDLGERRAVPGEEMTLKVNAYTEVFDPAGGATIRGTITDPLGQTHEVAFQEDLATPGAYTASFVPAAEGVYEVSVSGEMEGVTIGESTKSFLARPSAREYYDATLKRPFLENLARTAGGFYHSPEEASDLPELLRSRRTNTSIYRADYLWDMPLLFVLILALLSAEWIYRRRKGLP